MHFRKIVTDLKTKVFSAIKVQALLRGKLSRLWFFKNQKKLFYERKVRLVKKRNKSAIIIQKKFRFHLCKKILMNMRRKKTEEMVIHEFDQKLEGQLVIEKMSICT